MLHIFVFERHASDSDYLPRRLLHRAEFATLAFGISRSVRAI